MISVGRAIDPRRFSPRIIRQRLLALRKLLDKLGSVHGDVRGHNGALDRAAEDVTQELQSLLSSTEVKYDSPYLSRLSEKLRLYVADVEGEVVYRAKTEAYLSKDDLNEIIHDRDALRVVLSEGVDEGAVVRMWQQFVDAKAQAAEAIGWFHGLAEEFSVDSEETLFHASLYARDLARNGWSHEPGVRTGVGSFGKQKEVSFTYSLVYAQQLYQFFVAAWMVANGKLTVERAAGLFRAKHESYYKSEKALHGLDVLDANGNKRHPREVYEPKDQALNEFRNFVRMYNVSVQYLAVVGAEQLYEQLRMIALSSIGIVKCKVDTIGAQHLPGEQELRVLPSAIKSTVLVTSARQVA